MSDGNDHAERVRLTELLAALSLVSDLARGRPAEEAMRACVLAAALAQEIGASEAEAVDTYFATLLRSVGCTATSHEYAAGFGGDDVRVRGLGDLIDPDRPQEALPFLWAASRPAAGSHARTFLRAAHSGRRIARDGARADCEVGSRMARRFGLPHSVERALLQVFERWDGSGSPLGLAGEAIVLPARVAAVACAAIVFEAVGGQARALEFLRRWAGRALDPSVVAVLVSRGEELFAVASPDDPWLAAVGAEPGSPRYGSERDLDEIARGFADAVDLKSPYLHGHTAGVATLAERAGASLGLDRRQLVAVRRAALFHDLGRVGIATGIWEKPGPLTTIEWEQVRLHTYHTERILRRAPALAGIARLAGMHHERLDGSGYHRGAPAAMLDVSSRVLAAADVFQALSEERPHRSAMSRVGAARLLETLALDRDAVRAVVEAAGERPGPRPRDPSGLSPRELEVLRLLVRGHSERQIAQSLVVSGSTVHTHVAHIYEKTGVSTRAGLAFFAMEHDLIKPGEPAAEL